MVSLSRWRATPCSDWSLEGTPRTRGCQTAKKAPEPSSTLPRRSSQVWAKILTFGRPDRHADIVKLLREFYAEERELENDEALREIVRQAKLIPELMILPGAPRAD